MSMRLGKSNAWSVSGRGKIANAISISYELVERTSEKTTYKVIVTIDNLSVRMNRRVDDGEIYVCLYEKCCDSKGYNESFDGDSRYGSPSYATANNLVHGGLAYWRYLQKVVRGKNQYVYTVTLNADDSDYYYDSYNDYSRIVESVKWYNYTKDYYDTYYNVGASLLHIRNYKWVYTSGEGYKKCKNTFLKSLSDSGCFDMAIYAGDDKTKTCFDNMPSFASNLAYTPLIKLEL